MRIAKILLAALLGSAALPCAAQEAYPARPVRIIVAYPAGGANDIVARTIGQELAQDLGQPVLIENRSGAAGTIGADAAAKSAPDGYTLFMAAGAHTLAPSLHAKLPYDIVQDFQPISLAALGTYLLVIHPSVLANSVKELIELAKAKPGALNFASSGAGAPPHLAGVLFQKLAGVTLNHVPYRGDTPAITDLIGGQVQLAFLSIQPLIPQVKAGKLRALAITSGRRSPAVPDLPTVAESGLTGYDVGTWWGLLAPAKTPRPIVDRLAAAMLKATAVPAVKERFAAGGNAAQSNSPEEFAAMIRSEVGRYRELAAAAGVKPE
ncbi:MAG: tripartite tricarboxylate transporter substrate binding protein [Alphaproteobacteria bacterium]|nr:tripartite tricarboxylate transporter substrate binding protein [Alphaproteobacteria bacterium]